MDNILHLLLLISSCLLVQAASLIAFFLKQNKLYLLAILALTSYATYALTLHRPLGILLISVHLVAYIWLLAHTLRSRKEYAHSNHLHNLGLLCSEICHDLASPLMVIETSLMVLKNKLGKSDVKHHKSFERMDRQVKKLYQILLRFRSLTTSKSLVAEWHIIHIENTLDDSLQKLKAINHEVELFKKVHLVEQEVQLALEQAELQQVFSALFLNAHEACTNEKTCLSVSINEDESHLICRIEDNGRGFERKKWKQAFKPFYSSKAHGKGLGLGLPVVLKILEKAMGTIELKSSYPTVIEITLPKVSASKVNPQSMLLSPSQTL